MSSATSAETLKSFFAAYGRGDVDGVVATFHPRAQIQAVRKSTRTGQEVYGFYERQTGARELIGNLGNAFEPQAFNIARVGGDGNVAFAERSFVEKVKATGKLFRSDWALICVVEDGKILEYHFYEDSAALVIAQAP